MKSVVLVEYITKHNKYIHKRFSNQNIVLKIACIAAAV